MSASLIDRDADQRPEPRTPIRPTSEAPRPGLSRTPAGDGGQGTHSPFLPLLLLAIALVSWLCFQTVQLVRERTQFTDARIAQQAQVDAATRVRANLDALAASTQRLANAGNANARLVIDELRKRGVNVNPNPVTTPAPNAK